MKRFINHHKLISPPIQNSTFKIQHSTFPFLSLLRSLTPSPLRFIAPSSLRPLAFSLLLALAPFSLPAQQQWTEPLNISNLGGYSMDPDMVIDHNGVIHVVWTYQNSAFHWLIMYTCSEDDGQTWTEPLDLLQNTDLWMLQPHIACDSKNNLYVTYTHDGNSWTPEGRLIKMITWDGYQWSEPITVSEGMPGSNYSSVIIDQKDKPYVFWLIGAQMGNIDMYYRYYEEEIWSDFYCPYCDSSVAYLPTMNSLKENVMHWAGVYQISMVEKPVYFKFDSDLNTWEYPEMINNDTIVVDIDISLNHSHVPETVYRKREINPMYGSDVTMHTKKEGNNWSIPDLVSGTDKRQVGQQIAIDQNNDVHVVETEFYASSISETQLVHYYKIGDRWLGQPIDSSNHMCHFPKLLFVNNRLYVVYRHSNASGTGDLRFSKYDIITNIKEETKLPKELTIYPNPGRGNVYIEFVPIVSHEKNNQAQHINISVFDVRGQHIITLANKKFPPGKQRLLWKGTDKNGKEVNSGLYLVRLQSGRNNTSQTVEIIK